MKRVNAILKVSLIFFALFSIITICVYFFTENNFKIKYETKSLTFSTYSYIEVSVLDFSVNIFPNTSQEIMVEYFSDTDLGIEKSENILKITQKNAINIPVLLFDKKEKYINIYLPQKDYNYIRVINSSGNININDIKSETFDFSSKNGNITLKNTYGDVVLVTTGGKIYAELTDFDNLTVNTNSGISKIFIPKIDFYNVDFKLNEGKVNTFFLDEETYFHDFKLFDPNCNKNIKITTKKGEIFIMENTETSK